MRSVQRPGSSAPSPNPTPETVLITGGAGFIGSHLADELQARGHRVRALDSLIPQVHGDAGRPDELAADVELQEGDVRDGDTMRRALDGVDSVVHLAARVGVGQSMYEIAEYTAVNSLGTAALLEELAAHPVRKLLVASSMSVYGEGLYRDADGSPRRASRAHARTARAPGLGVRGPRAQTARALLDLRADEVRPGARVSRRGRCVRHPDRRIAAVQHVRAAAGALESLHGCSGHLRVASAQRPAAAYLRGRAPAP